MISDAFDHWVGTTVPLRGPNRQIIGEATITDTFVADGKLTVTIETSVDVGIREVADTILGDRPAMSFRPMRDDPVAEWLKAKRDACAIPINIAGFSAIDDILDEYRARADYGLTLDADISEELPDGY